MTTQKISAKGWLVIPSALRRKYGLNPGVTVQVVDYGGVVALVPLLKNPIKQAAGMLRGDNSLTEVLLKEHAQEVAREP